MIPKQLFFIWIGDSQPDYVNFAINSFKEINPDFRINFLRYKIADIEDKRDVGEFDSNMYNCVDYINKCLSGDSSVPYFKNIRRYKSYGRKFSQILANIVRLDILNQYGGIYLDCDIFAVRPFDSTLMERDFVTNSCTSYDIKYRHKDSHFFGIDSNVKYSVYHDIPNVVNTNYLKFSENENWIRRRDLFYKCSLTANDYDFEDYPYYVEHFVDRTWNTGRTPVCKYDR